MLHGEIYQRYLGFHRLIRAAVSQRLLCKQWVQMRPPADDSKSGSPGLRAAANEGLSSRHQRAEAAGS